MKLTIDNLKSVKWTYIAVFNNRHLVDVICKDVNCDFAPYTIGGSDNIFDEKEILNFFKDQEYFIYDIKSILKPKE